MAWKSIKGQWGDGGGGCCWGNHGELGIRGHIAEVDWPNWHFWPSCHIPA